MDQARLETIQTILELVQSLEPRLKGMHPDELKEEITKTHRVNLDEDDEDKLDDLALKLARIKKSRPVSSSRTMESVAPVRGTPPPISIAVSALTDFKVNDRIKHLNCPDWGEGDITYVEPIQISGEVKQKCTIIFNRMGKKTLIVRPGMLERLPSPTVVSKGPPLATQ